MGSGVRGEVTSLHHSASEWQSGAYSPGLRAPRAHTFTTRDAMFFPVLEELLEKTDVQRVEREEREGRGRRNGSGPSTAGRGRMVSPGEPVGKAGQTSCPLWSQWEICHSSRWFHCLIFAFLHLGLQGAAATWACLAGRAGI